MRDRMRKTIITLLVVIAMMIGIMPFENSEIIADGEDVQEITSVTVNVSRPRVGELLESATVDEDQPYSRVRSIWLYNIAAGIVMPADVELPADDAGKIVYVEIVLGSEGESVFSDSLSASDVTIPGAIEIVKFNNYKTTLTLGASFEVLSDNSIPEITLSVTPPVVGGPTSGNGADVVTGPEGVHYQVHNKNRIYDWYESSSYDDMATDTFQPGDAGKEVSIDILVMADSGYKFANPVIVKADGSSKETTVSFGENTQIIACTVFFKVQGDETAVTEYPLWIGGVQVTSKNQDDVLNDGKVKFEVKNGENILTLNGATITGYHAEGDESACIFVTDYDLDLKINLIGKNNVGSYAAKYGISQFKGKLTLTGSGSLTIDEYPTYAAIFAADLSIEKTSIDLNGWFYGLITKNSITISDSNVKTRSESSLGTGIESMTGNIEILDSTVNAGGGLFGIHTADATKVRIAGNGTVTAVAIDDEKGRAILANDIELDGVEITFPENGYVGSCEYNGQARKTIYNSENNIYRIAVIKLVSLSYSVVSGAEGTYTLNSGNDYVLAVKRSTRDEICIDHFESVELDGQALEKDTDYTAVKGSTVVTLKASTLNKLSEEKHTLTVNFDDGKAETSLTVKAAPAPTPDPTPVTPYQIPKTGVE